MNAALEQALWSGDIDTLNELAPCRCCCHEHTFDGCLARAWFGCRGQFTMTHTEEESWARHYESAHGMTRDQFFNDGVAVQ